MVIEVKISLKIVQQVCIAFKEDSVFISIIHTYCRNIPYSLTPEPLVQPYKLTSSPEVALDIHDHSVSSVGFGDWLASLTGECSLDASLYAGQPNSRISTNQLYLGFMIVVLGVYEIPQGNSHYILYVGSLIVLSSTLN